MRALSLVRTSETLDVVTFGQMVTEQGTVICFTLEEPWRDANGDGLGDKNVSRIPAGSYRAFRRLSPARKVELFELEGVPGRGNIQIHSGNTTDDTLGCIILGTKIGALNGKPAVLDSKAAFKRFMLELADESEFMLTVSDVAFA